MGRLTLNMLLSFAQFEREATGEWIRARADACVTAHRDPDCLAEGAVGTN